MAIPDANRLCEISKQAIELWENFAELYGLGSTPDVLLRPAEGSPFGRPRWAAEFFEFCAQMQCGSSYSPIILGSLDHILKGRRDGEATSWLYNHPPSPTQDRPYAIVDFGVLKENLPLARVHRTCVCLILHEAGHLILHWKQLKDQWLSGAHLRITEASITQEFEAWWFCYSVIGFGIASFSQSKDTSPLSHDPAWKIAG